MKWAIFVTVFLTSCTNHHESERALRAAYAGKNVDGFFVRHGPPISSHRLNSGGTLYLWEKHGSTVTLPGSARSTTEYTPNAVGYGGTATTTTSYAPPRTLHALCQLQIATDARGRVSDLKFTKDSWGDWTTSWAHEYFSEERKAVQTTADRTLKSKSSTSDGTLYH